MDEALSHALDVYDDAWNCILSGEPRTEELIKLKDLWGTFEWSEFKKLEDNICLLFLKGKSDTGTESDIRNAVKVAVKTFVKEHFHVSVNEHLKEAETK